MYNKGEIKVMKNNNRIMAYGKGDVFAYRTHLAPLKGVKEIPESNFTGRSNIIFGANIRVEVGGSAFLSSFTEGDNRLVVVTDSMKNFIQQHLASYSGTTMEGFLDYVGRSFLLKYSQIDSVKLTGEHLSFQEANMFENEEIKKSPLVFNHSRNKKAVSSIHLIRHGQDINVESRESSICDLQLIKVSGNSFVGFIRDEYTTLPEDGNRPLFIYLNIGWNYENSEDALGETPSLYVASEQIHDIASSVFHELETPSIQNLIYRIGCRILERFPQLQSVNFQSQNHTWDTVVEEIPGEKGKVYTEPKPPFGFQLFSVTKEDLKVNSSKEKETKLK
jgi:urate oxidase/2-oxo-4-hydroxy-4-carboxy-5-ureidoimidazoline decarboxylase